MTDPTTHSRLMRAWRAVLPAPWHSDDPAPGDHWDDLRHCYVTTRRLRLLAIILVAFGVVYIGANGVGGNLAPDADLNRGVWVGVFVAIAAAIAFLLSRAIQVGAQEVPPVSEVPSVSPEDWLKSRERAVPLAKIYSEARTFLAIYYVLGGLILLAIVALIVASTVQNGSLFGGVSWLGPAPGQVVSGVQPYVTGGLSLLALGSVALVNSAYRELSVLRAELAHMHRKMTQALPSSPPEQQESADKVPSV